LNKRHPDRHFADIETRNKVGCHGNYAEAASAEVSGRRNRYADRAGHQSLDINRTKFHASALDVREAIGTGTLNAPPSMSRVFELGLTSFERISKAWHGAIPSFYLPLADPDL
jgi:hypothetical protein